MAGPAPSRRQGDRLGKARSLRVADLGPQVAAAPVPMPTGMSRPFEPVVEPPRRRRAKYRSTTEKLVIAGAAAFGWVSLSAWLDLAWLRSSEHHLALVPAILVVALVALFPGLLVAFLTAALLLDRRPPFRVAHPTTPVTVLIAARNEETGIVETLEYLGRQDYDGPMTIMLVDNGSSDRTVDAARAWAATRDVPLEVVQETRPGKSHALNRGLRSCTTPLVITVDADTLLHPSAVRLLVARMASSPDDTVAVAGCVLVRNSRASLWSRLQVWDYFLGIASIKRMQALFQSTLVAQGAFSLYRAQALEEVGGWPDAIGEDIVLTWRLLREGGSVSFEPLAVCFTEAPSTLRGFARQRARWARGMIEGLRAVPPWRHGRLRTFALTATNVVIPCIDVGYVVFWIPGLILACFGFLWIVGPMTALVLPLTFVVYFLLYRYQRDQVFKPLGLRIRKNPLGLVLFILVYQPIMSAMSVRGYVQELFGLRRRWR